MRLLAFILGMVGVLASAFAAILLQMVLGLTDHVLTLTYVSAWSEVALALAGSILIWWRPRWSALGFAIAAVGTLVSLHYVAIPAAVMLLAAAVVSFFAYGKHPTGAAE